MSRLVLLFAVALALALGCSKREAPGAAEGGSSSSAQAAPRSSSTVIATPTPAEGRALVVAGCLACHSEHMLAQQRLTEAQWTKVVAKMVGWGANVEPAEVRPLVAYLAASYGPDAGPYEAETLSASAAAAELAAVEDPFPPGDPERGRALFVDRCSGCHGSDARGHLGVTLVDRPFLRRGADFASTVRRGRGKMLPIALSDAEIADVLAHLRRLQAPPP